ncbi:hypothetical protein [Streptosporangium saharense]|uniref:Uncharacterized protein n=1 Tax=Streptosporangium saharense TaxID=1706840 RepID=A0A7W7QHZ0_9ACTN|nr:hypothetical protein [Streptosporangium saharense]MBB4913925.1 hypothetical protein [Streptosporangium saharense]
MMARRDQTGHVLGEPPFVMCDGVRLASPGRVFGESLLDMGVRLASVDRVFDEPPFVTREGVRLASPGRVTGGDVPGAEGRR